MLNLIYLITFLCILYILYILFYPKQMYPITSEENVIEEQCDTIENINYPKPILHQTNMDNVLGFTQVIQ